MNLTRLRQRYASGIANFSSSGWYWAGGWSNPSVTPSTRLGETKSVYDVGPSRIVSYKTDSNRVSIKTEKRVRVPGSFQPFQVSSIVYGNSIFDGSGDVECRTSDNAAGLNLRGAFLVLTPAANQTIVPMDANSFIARNLSAEQWCLQQCIVKASEPIHAFGVTLGELSETVKMLMSPSRALLKLCTKYGLAGGNFQRAATRGRNAEKLLFKPSKNVSQKIARNFGKLSKRQVGCYVVNQTSDFWLSWRFGVEPLIKEIGDIMSLDWGYWHNPDVRLAKKRFVESKQRQILNDQTFSAGRSGFYSVCTIDSYKELSTQATISYQVKRGLGLDEALNGYGLSLRHLPGVLWELTPLSFVIDRFVDVSSFIGAITPDPSVRQLQNCVSRNQHSYIDIIFTRGYYSGGYIPIYKVNKPVKRFRIFVNQYTRGVNVPIDWWPQINPRLTNLKQYVDHATLLWQRIPKFK